MSTNLARVITWTHRDGVKSVSPDMTRSEAEALAAMGRKTNPAWVHFDVEAA